MIEIKEKPILYSPPMVRSTLRGIKTNTRRVMKGVYDNGDWSIQKAKEPRFHGHTHDWYLNGAPNPHAAIKCPYGQVGDQLWAREKFQPIFADGVEHGDYVNYKTGEGYAVSYPATDGIIEFVTADEEISSACKPSIHMPRWASRIQMEITDIRIERLQDISDEDALAEGIVEVYDIVEVNCHGGNHNEIMGYRYFYDSYDGEGFEDPVSAFQHLWESINGAGSWDLDPLVWVIEFKVIKP